jgi:hypothetical protein
MEKINHTVVAVALIIAITIIVALALTRPAIAPVTGSDPGTSAEPAEPIESENEEVVAPNEPEPEPDVVACTMDAKMCPDGSFVGRVGPDCEFAACPPVEEVDEPIACTKDAKECPDGSYVGREAPDCEFAACPVPEEPVFCTQDVKECPDGSYVGRVPPNCEFKACPSGGGNLQLQLGQ